MVNEAEKLPAALLLPDLKEGAGDSRCRRCSSIPLLVLCGLVCSLVALTYAWEPFPAAAGDWQQDFQRELERVKPFLHRYGYAAIFLAILVEGVGVPAPGQTLLIAGALSATQGGLKIPWVLLWAFLASFVGPCLGYLLGRRGGRSLLARLHVNERHFARLQGSFDRYGPGLILGARFLDGLRQWHGFTAGLAQMPAKAFILYSVVGALLWTGVWGLGAYFLDRQVTALHLSWQALRPWLLGATGIIILVGLLFLLRPDRRSP